jgi:hypothetical protein
MSDAGNSLRNSASSSIEQVNQQFSQSGQDLYNKTKDAASDFGDQLQNFTGMNSQSPAPTGAAPTSQRYAPAPPIASPQSVAPTSGGWTSMNPALAPPRLATPPLPSGVRVASNPSSVRTSAGPSFPPPPSTDASQQRSLLTTAPQGNSREVDDPWDSVTGNAATPASIGSDAEGVGMVPVQPRMRTAATSSQPLPPPPAASAGPTAPPLDERYKSASGNGADEWANFRPSQADVFNDPRMPSVSQQPQQPNLAAQQQPQQQPFAGGGAATQPNIGTQPPTIPTVATGQPATPPEEVPWKPLLAVSLALAGSLGANFYLGMSYAEARHRYRTLVAKMTHAFEKKAGLAA